MKKNSNTIPLSQRLDAIQTDLQEHKALDVVTLNISTQTGNFADFLIVATATSQRHARSLADAMADLCHENGYEYLRVEGYQEGQWILVDMNDIVLNIFQAETRSLYRLEDLWGNISKGQA